jgi:dimethylhistidine N-methyltransferase
VIPVAPKRITIACNTQNPVIAQIMAVYGYSGLLKILHVELKKNSMDNAFANDVAKGLSSSPKYLLSKYFYDERGDVLFQKIMGLSEYYLTDCEFEILHSNRNRFLNIFQNANSPFLLTELGAGDGLKTKVLLRHFYHEGIQFSYLPIDISENVLQNLSRDLKEDLPDLDVKIYPGDYFEALNQLNKNENGRKVLLFLGSTIGNFEYEEAIQFLRALNDKMNPKDQLVIGFDLKKDPRVILRAYNDKSGITAQFNLNLLRRINKELGGNFILDNFYHYPVYNPLTGEAQSFLVSKIAQEVWIEKLNQSFNFKMGETIFMEVSQKYDLEMIHDLAVQCGFMIKQNVYDSRHYFVNSIWVKQE